MQRLLLASAFISLLLTGAIFGFFYAWVCSTMWGLDRIDPRHAIEAMIAINESVRNLVFAPAFFGTTLALLITATLSAFERQWEIASIFVISALIYLIGAQVLTMLTNVPLNQNLAITERPTSLQEAQLIWTDYSSKWQFWNRMRTITSGISMLLCGYGIYLCGKNLNGSPSYTTMLHKAHTSLIKLHQKQNMDL